MTSCRAVIFMVLLHFMDITCARRLTKRETQVQDRNVVQMYELVHSQVRKQLNVC